ncbi:MAG: tRNA pseudouridine(55) synthase [uncultured Thermomicrobiales bacterium]|uniref:tRNA pseudouridine synthase B n=1 Tax=uncultured Thermomicrobiales bacterium TaxID=1645740 RepID=A0A6J4V860_9BACT|nr:MAG: tRNA pseudouridine(55) synthase [uncultured Thermomicrobiales bacterium]
MSSSAPSDVPPPRPSLHGFLVIDKPAGWTSHDVVARVRRLVGERRVGHAGTLDPAATGVLPLAVGTATRVLEYLAGADKTYRAEVTFGVETDSQDGDGRVVARRDASALSEAAVAALLPAFRGPLQQIPPMHSAIKVGGQRLYERAHRGEEIEREPRPVVVHRLQLLDWRPPVATLLVDCSKGTYVRALARDLGAAAGVGAFLSDLVRLRTGPFALCQALTLDALADAPLPWAWPAVAVHPDAVLPGWTALLLDDEGRTDWGAGRAIAAPAAAGRCRAYGLDGAWLGVGAADDSGRAWRPLKVVEGAA